jgi:hypothetical protein
MSSIKPSKYMAFQQITPPGTSKPGLIVRNKKSGGTLGYIEWYGPWRQYCFFPEGDTVFNRTCLDEINAVISCFTENKGGN